MQADLQDSSQVYTAQGANERVKPTALSDSLVTNAFNCIFKEGTCRRINGKVINNRYNEAIINCVFFTDNIVIVQGRNNIYLETI